MRLSLAFLIALLVHGLLFGLFSVGETPRVYGAPAAGAISAIFSTTRMPSAKEEDAVKAIAQNRSSLKGITGPLVVPVAERAGNFAIIKKTDDKGAEAAPKYYWSAKELNKRPIIDGGFNPDSLELAGVDGGGRLVLMFFISELGDVDQIDVESSDAPSEAYGIVLGQFYKAHFHPGVKDGLPVPSRTRIEVVIAPSSRTLRRDMFEGT